MFFDLFLLSKSTVVGDFSKVVFYQSKYEQAKKAMKELLWNETDGIWYDYDLEAKVYFASFPFFFFGFLLFG